MTKSKTPAAFGPSVKTSAKLPGSSAVPDIPITRVSRAPTPITPLPSVYSVKQGIEKSSLPNWKKWIAIPEFKIWEAVALSVNVEPDSEREIHSEEILMRLFVVQRNVNGGAQSLRLQNLHMVDFKNSTVKITDFVAWALRMEWEIPKELREMLSVTKRPPNSEEEWRKRALMDLWTIRESAFLICGRVPDSAAATDAELNEVIEQIHCAIQAGALEIIGENGHKERLYDSQKLRPIDVSRWAAKRYSQFPLALRDAVETSSTITNPKPDCESEELKPRERETLLKLAAYLATKNKFKPNDKNSATGKIILEMDKCGINLSERTLRELMKKAIKWKSSRKF